jgi:hypothetical protein
MSDAKELVSVYLLTRLMILLGVISFVIAATTLSLKWMSVTLKSPPPQVRVDTLRSVVYDSTTVIARAKDTVRVVELQVGPLTEQRLAWLICGGAGRAYGDKRDLFQYNLYGMIFCPKDPPKE